jgi:1,4-dihydroxy-2-naphthoate octaprenyltransferase
MKPKMTFFTFISAYRIVYAIPFVLASLTGVVRGYFATLDVSLCLLVLWVVFWLAMFVNLSNDYFDHLSGADRERFTMEDEKKKYIYEKVLNAKVYWQGNLFDLGYLSKKQGRFLLGFILLIILISAYPLLIVRGSIVLALGITGFLLSFFYTAPPLNLGANGFGEITVLVSFFMMSYFSAYVIMGFHSGEMFIFSIAVGVTGFLMRLADEMTGYEAHKASLEKDLSVRMGIPMTINLIQAFLGLLYSLFIFNAFYFKEWKLVLPILTFPNAIQILSIYRKNQDEFRVLRAVPLMLKLSIGTSVLIFITWLSVFLLP